MLGTLFCIAALVVAITIVLWWFDVPLTQVSRATKRANKHFENREFAAALHEFAKVDQLAKQMKSPLARGAYEFIAALGQGLVLNAEKRFDQALVFWRRAQSHLDQTVYQPPLVQCQVLCQSALANYAIQRTHTADKLLDRAETLARSLNGRALQSVLEQMRAQADGASGNDQFAMAKRLLEFVVKTLKKNPDLPNEMLANTQLSLGQLDVMLGEYGSAREHLNRVLSGRDEAEFPVGTRETVWLALGNLDTLQGRMKSAIECQQKLLQSQRDRQAANWELANSEMSLANTYRMHGDYPTAWTHAKHALAAASTLAPEDSLFQGIACQCAIHMLDANEYREADRLLSLIETTQRGVVREATAILALARLIRSLYHRDLERYSAALKSGQDALEIAESVFGHDHHMTSESRMVLSATLARLGRVTEAAQLLGGVETAYAAKLDRAFFNRVDLLLAQAELCLAQGKANDTERKLNESLELLSPVVLPSHCELASIQQGLGEVSALQGKHDLANEHFANSEQIRLQSQAPSHPRLALLYDAWAKSLQDGGRTEEAAQRRSLADSIREQCRSYP